MTYEELLGPALRNSVQKDGYTGLNLIIWGVANRTGYNIYGGYLQHHLETLLGVKIRLYESNVFVYQGSSSRFSLPNEYSLGHYFDNFHPEFPTIINHPIPTAIRSETYGLLMGLLESCKGPILSVIHDSELVNGAPVAKPAKYIAWLGENARHCRARVIDAFDQMCALSKAVVAPSEFIAKTFAWAKPTVIPHPFESRLSMYRFNLHRDPDTILLTSLYKQDPLLLGRFIHQLDKGKTLLVPHQLPEYTASQFNLFDHPQVKLIVSGNFRTMYAYMNTAGCVVDLASLAESFGFFVREALFLGCPVYGRRVGALAEITDENFHDIDKLDLHLPS